MSQLRLILTAMSFAGVVVLQAQEYCPWRPPTTGMELTTFCAPNEGWCSPGDVEFSLKPYFFPFPPAPHPYTIQWCDTVTWDFGDGTTETHYGHATARHRYLNDGNYDVRVRIQNAAGHDVMKREIVISRGEPARVYFPTFFDPPVFEESNEAVSLPIALRAPVNRMVKIDYVVSGVVVKPSSGTLVFLPHVTEASIPLQLIDDDRFALSPRIEVQLRNGFGGTVHESVPWYAAAVKDNEPSPTLSVHDVVVRETDGVVKIPVHIDPALATGSARGFRADCFLLPGTATDADYRVEDGRLLFGDGQRVAEITVKIIDDSVFESAETFQVRCSDFEHLANPGYGTVTIVGNDTRRRAARH